MTQPGRSPKYHTSTVGVTRAEARLIPRSDQQLPDLFGPFDFSTYLFCFADPGSWAQPGYNTFNIDLQQLGPDTYWIASAWVTELSPPSTPWRGDADFQTLSVQLNQPVQLVTVYFLLQWDAPLPVAIMTTIGSEGQPR